MIIRCWLCSGVIGKGFFRCVPKYQLCNQIGYEISNCTSSIKDEARNAKKHLFHHEILKVPIASLQVPLGMLWLDGDDADRAENLAAQEVVWGRTDIFNGVEAS